MGCMLCDKFEKCGFYEGKGFELSQEQFDWYVRTYCKGELQSCCKRKKWIYQFGTDPPDELCPDGRSVITSEEMYE